MNSRLAVTEIITGKITGTLKHDSAGYPYLHLTAYEQSMDVYGREQILTISNYKNGYTHDTSCGYIIPERFDKVSRRIMMGDFPGDPHACLSISLDGQQAIMKLMRNR